MKQPMSKREIEVWDEVFTGLITQHCCIPERVPTVATAAIAARRAALIADAHVGTWNGDVFWSCRCEEGVIHGIDSDYCEECHTRRPDEVYRLSDDGHVEAAT